MIIGGVLGILISLLEEFLPKKVRQMAPLGHGPWAGRRHHAIELVLDVLRLADRLDLDEKASKILRRLHDLRRLGLIAGESLTGVGMNLVVAAPTIGPAIWQSIRAFFGG